MTKRNLVEAMYEESTSNKVAHELASARHLLKALREKLGTHPELEEAIEKVEMALNHLTLNTGGML
ncbi:MAG: hypothetical protein AB7O65_08365 [Candidatus Korobacteraceae bacterium]